MKVSSFLLLPLATLARAGPHGRDVFYAVVLPVGRGGATLRPQLLRAHRGDRDAMHAKSRPRQDTASRRTSRTSSTPSRSRGMPRPTCEAPWRPTSNAPEAPVTDRARARSPQPWCSSTSRSGRTTMPSSRAEWASTSFSSTASSPAPCWKGRISGSGTNYGKAGNPENYQETLNRALEKATAELLSEKSFQDALCGKCSCPLSRPVSAARRTGNPGL